jgi:lauroyl/myristoyl acyltransferase
MMTDDVERSVRRNPEQWWWLQKRWKDYYPELYPENFKSQARKLRRRLEKKKKRLK